MYIVERHNGTFRELHWHRLKDLFGVVAILRGGSQVPWQATEVWSDAELAAIEVWRVPPTAVPQGYRSTGYTFADRGDGIPHQVHTLVDISAELAAIAAQEAHDTEFRAIPERQDFVTRLKSATKSEIDTWIDNNTSNLSQTRALLKRVVYALALHIRD